MAVAPSRIKAFNVYLSGRKIGTLENATLTLMANDEEHVTAEGWSASDGTLTSQLKCSTVTPIDGEANDFVTAMEQKKYLSVQIGVVNGKVWAIQMRCFQAEYTTDPKTGSLKGSFDLKGGAADRM